MQLISDIPGVIIFYFGTDTIPDEVIQIMKENIELLKTEAV